MTWLADGAASLREETDRFSDSRALETFAARPLVEAAAPDAHAELELVEVVQILCRRVRSLERQLAEARR